MEFPFVLKSLLVALKTCVAMYKLWCSLHITFKENSGVGLGHILGAKTRQIYCYSKLQVLKGEGNVVK